ncbi:MAG: GNAT family N-acetyltransferase [Candidatus Methylomirabilales bacterium]
MDIYLRLLTGQPCEMAALQRILEATPTDAELGTGHPPGVAEAQSLLTALPPGMTHDSKYLYGFMTDVPQLVGCADLIRGWPTDSTTLLGLLLLDEEHQGHGLGESAYQEVEAKVRRWPEIDTLRVSVVRSSAAVLPFWRRIGFIETGEVQPLVYDKLVSESIILAKPLYNDARA